jgi:hypothetical protein
MPGADYSKHSDAQLVEAADDGLHGQGAVIEALKRHRDALLREQEASTALNQSMRRLGAVGVVLALVGVVVAALQLWAALK